MLGRVFCYLCDVLGIYFNIVLNKVMVSKACVVGCLRCPLGCVVRFGGIVLRHERFDSDGIERFSGLFECLWRRFRDVECGSSKTSLSHHMHVSASPLYAAHCAGCSGEY